MINVRVKAGHHTVSGMEQCIKYYNQRIWLNVKMEPWSREIGFVPQPGSQIL